MVAGMMAMKAQFKYVGIRVTNLQKSIDFYTKVLGLKLEGQNKSEVTKGELADLRSEGSDFPLELNYYPKDSPYYSEYTPGEGLDHLAFKVENLDKALDEAQKVGYKTVLQMKGDEGGRWAYIQDPDGNWIELF